MREEQQQQIINIKRIAIAIASAKMRRNEVQPMRFAKRTLRIRHVAGDANTHASHAMGKWEMKNEKWKLKERKYMYAYTTVAAIIYLPINVQLNRNSSEA